MLLDVTPTILSDSRISIRIRPEVSEPSITDGISLQGVFVPGIRIRRADTTVELASGQSFILAGLLKSDLSSAAAKLPGLGDIPVFGALARSSELERADVELVIVATATIATPTYEVPAIPNENIRLTGPFSRLFTGEVMLPATAIPQDFIF